MFMSLPSILVYDCLMISTSCAISLPLAIATSEELDFDLDFDFNSNVTNGAFCNSLALSHVYLLN